VHAGSIVAVHHRHAANWKWKAETETLPTY